MMTLNLAKDAAFLALPREAQQRVFRHFTTTGHCWRFQMSPGARYGRVGLGKLKIQAHRAAYLATHGPIPDGLLVLHRCNNPKCINPAHLKAGTQVENMDDRSRCGRHWLQSHPEKSSIHAWNKERAVLTPETLARITQMRADGATHQSIADALKCSRTTVSNAIANSQP